MVAGMFLILLLLFISTAHSMKYLAYHVRHWSNSNRAGMNVTVEKDFVGPSKNTDKKEKEKKKECEQKITWVTFKES